jgi:uncharacterized protein YqeY
MKLKEQIHNDFIIAFKSKEMDKKTLLGVIKGDIQNQEGRGVESTDENILKIIKKMEKSLKQTNTPESLKELEYIKPYLPIMMEGKEIRKIIHNYINNGLGNIGQIMGEFNKKYKGLADNGVVSQIAKELITNIIK